MRAKINPSSHESAASISPCPSLMLSGNLNAGIWGGLNQKTREEKKIKSKPPPAAWATGALLGVTRRGIRGICSSRFGSFSPPAGPGPVVYAVAVCLEESSRFFLRRPDPCTRSRFTGLTLRAKSSTRAVCWALVLAVAAELRQQCSFGSCAPQDTTTPPHVTAMVTHQHRSARALLGTSSPGGSEAHGGAPGVCLSPKPATSSMGRRLGSAPTAMPRA